MDIALPRMDGFSVIKKIRNNKQVADIPVIALTSYAMKGDRERIIKAGCNDYMAKPINIDELLEKVEKYLGK